MARSRVEIIAGTVGGQTSPLSTTQPTVAARIQTSDAGPLFAAGKFDRVAPGDAAQVLRS